ncbi:MAG TPA: DUF429 domain-containing protein, partial [Pseudonocardiaceae bacterium]|nr:DUF429 domain-containing protein [Pseudonocardiaceae bacterium]
SPPHRAMPKHERRMDTTAIRRLHVLHGGRLESDQPGEIYLTNSVTPGNARLDDVLDAAAAAWSAHRIAIGHASRLPTEPSPGQEHISIQY